MNVIEFKGVRKKFRKGEKINSLRDFVPNLLKRLLSKNGRDKVLLRDKEFWALDDVSFAVAKGEILGIIGPNGAGKSTILKLLSGIIEPNTGKIKIMGRLSALIEVTAGFHPDLTGKENIYLNGTIIGMRKKEIDEKFDRIVDFSGLREFIDTPVKRYSSGMYSRLGFSVAAHIDPDILLVDEVLSVGDMAFEAKCSQKIRELLKSNTTIILVSHNLSLIKGLCKRVILLGNGKIIKEGSPEEVIYHYLNMVYKEDEEELKRKFSSGYKVELNPESQVEILDMSLENDKHEKKESFYVNEPISIKVAYEAKERIENPIFSVEIVRSDGVVCCSCNTKDVNFSINYIQNKGLIELDFGKINLAPGIYFVEIYIWNKEMIHTYAISKKDILKIETKQAITNSGVFLPEVKWKIV